MAQVAELQQRKADAVAAEDYDEAKHIKAAIDRCTFRLSISSPASTAILNDVHKPALVCHPFVVHAFKWKASQEMPGMSFNDCR